MHLPPEAAAQGWRFNYQQARAAGLTWKVLRRAVRDGVLVETAYGVYAVVGVATDALAVHRNLVLDAQLSSSRRWHAARRSSALLMGLPMIGRPPTVAQLVREGGRQGAHGRDRHRRVSPLASSDTWTYEGVDMTSPSRTVVDIARAESFRNAVVVADAALRRGVSLEELESVLARMRQWPGVVQARRAVRFADGRAESPGESLVRVASLRESLPVPEPQVEVYLRGEFLARVDGLVREQLLAVESDGAVKFTQAGVLPALIERQERLRYAGVDVLRTNWDETFRDTRRYGERMRARLRERGRRPLPPGVELRSTSVRPQAPLLGVSDDLAA